MKNLPCIAGLAGALLIVTGALFVGCSKKIVRNDSADTVPGPFFRTMVYACDGGGSWVARFETDSILLRGESETWRLPQTESRSGTRYADSARLFWINGSQATMQSPASPPRLCRYDSVATSWEQAWARGVGLRATGAEVVAKGRVDWSLEITPGRQAVFVTDNGIHRVTFTDTESILEPSAQRLYAGRQTLTVEWDRRPCREGTAGEPLGLVVKVDYAGKKYQGCGRSANPNP